jgi:DNA-binding XRE family transcriptional regulator
LDQNEIVQVVTSKFKLVRTEFNHTQEEMATRLGISKKTLVQIEKGRQSASWLQVIAICSLFQDSNILQDAFGGDPLEVIKIVTHKNIGSNRPLTLGGKVWWQNKKVGGGFKLQQNIVTGHYRILDAENRRYLSSLNKEYIYQQFKSLLK